MLLELPTDHLKIEDRCLNRKAICSSMLHLTAAVIFKCRHTLCHDGSIQFSESIVVRVEPVVPYCGRLVL